MPASRSRRPGAERPAPVAQRSPLRLLIPLAVVTVLVVVVVALPASLIRRALPPFVSADDFSGTLWHGSAGAITVQGRAAGALEWRVHPAALLSFTLSADLHWVNVGFVADAAADIDRHGLTAHDVRGTGPLEDLAALGLPPGWRGTTTFAFEEIRAAFIPDAPGGAGVLLQKAHGTVEVSGLSSPGIADGTDLGGYVAHIADTAEINDTGGPVELKASVQFAPQERTGTLSGALRARPGAAPALRSEIDALGRMHAPDAAGRIPVDLEFKF